MGPTSPPPAKGEAGLDRPRPRADGQRRLERCPLRRLGKPRLGATGAEAERWRGSRPGHGDAATISTPDRATGALPDRIVEDVFGEILDLGESELVALVDVGATGKGEHEQGAAAWL